MDKDVEQRFTTLMTLIQESQGHTAQSLEAIKMMLGVVAEMKESQVDLIARVEAIERQIGKMGSATTH